MSVQSGKRSSLAFVQVIGEQTLLDLFLREADDFRGTSDILSQEDEYQLTQLILVGDKSAHAEMVYANVRLVKKIAETFLDWGLRNGFELMDLIQEGNLGLLRAIETFDPEKGFKFSTYATWWIRQFIRNAVANGGLIRLPVSMRNLIWKIGRYTYEFELENGRRPSIDEIASEFAIRRDRVEEVLVANIVTSLPVSLEMPISQEDVQGASFGDLIADEQSLFETESVASIDLFRARVAIRRILKPEESKVIELRFLSKGLLSHGEVGEKLKLKREKVQQLERTALAKLRANQEFREKYADLLNTELVRVNV